MKKVELGFVAFCVGFMGLSAAACSLWDAEDGDAVVWLNGDVAQDANATPGEIRVEDDVKEEVAAQDVPQQLADVTEMADMAQLDVENGEIPCTPDCEGKVCGPDGCGSICGSCINPNACNEQSGQCQEDPPDCAGKECGSDGVGGSCGVCPPSATCNDVGKCVVQPPECDYCVDPYPVCIQINNVWSCVECQEDAGCPEGNYCDLTYYTCKAIPPDDAGWCNAENACLESDAILFDLACETDNELCYDQFGWCDDIFARCRPGSQCLIVSSIPGALIGPDPDFYPPGGGPGTVGLCSCQNPIEVTEMFGCMAEGAEPCPPSPECPGKQVCLPASGAVQFVPLPPTARVCVWICLR